MTHNYENVIIYKWHVITCSYGIRYNNISVNYVIKYVAVA